MSNTTVATSIATACAALMALAACCPEQVPSVVPNVESLHEPIGRRPHFPTPDELAFCFRLVPVARC